MAVVLKTVESYDRIAIKTAIVESLEIFGGLDKLLTGKQRVVLKPNFVVPEPIEGGATTHPDVYMAVAELLLDLGKSVTIGESPAFGATESAVRKHGVHRECREKGIDVLTFSKSRKIEGVQGHRYYQKMTIAAELQNFDAMINLPKLKVHQQFVFTGATKNLYGCVTGKRKACRHFTSDNDLVAFARMIHANAKAAAPVLNIADGISALHRHGPMRGDHFPLKRLLVGDNYFELDWLCAQMFGLDPKNTPLFAISSEQEVEEYKAAATKALETGQMPNIDGFLQSRVTPIEFSFFHMIRSAWKTLRGAS